MLQIFLSGLNVSRFIRPQISATGPVYRLDYRRVYRQALFLLGLTLGCLVMSVPARAIIFADGDLAPVGSPDGQVNTADYLVLSRIVNDNLVAGASEYAHGDVYPQDAPDGVLNIQDLLVLQQKVLDPTLVTNYENIALFADGPATINVTNSSGSSSTTLLTDGYTGPGATVTNNPSLSEPGNPANTVWHFSVSGGVANVFLGTADLASDPVFDSGFDFSGAGEGYLVFDIKVISISNGANLTAKIDSGYPDLGQYTLNSSDYALGEWRRVSISFAQLLSNPGPGNGLDLANVVNAFVLEVTGGSAEFYLDNIFIQRRCDVAGGCKASVKTKKEYQLVWSDEFNGSSLDTTFWNMETGYGSNGWGNDEWQQYTSSPSNVSVTGGNLVINARCSGTTSQCANSGQAKRTGMITSARINTLNKFSFKYGKIEARIKPPTGKGAWPAFWMLGANFPNVGWPRSGEIDVMEMHYRYSNDRTTHFTVHYCDDYVSNPCQYNPGWEYYSQYETFPYSLGDDYHIFSAEWDENSIVGKIDGITYYSIAIDPGNMDEFLKEFFTILNIAVGGTLGGSPDLGTTWPQTMLVDYVRVYEEVGGNGSYTIGTPFYPELGIYSETYTDGVLPFSAIINSADFGGNLLFIDQNSTAVSPLDGSQVLSAQFNNSGAFFGGFLFNFTIGRDISAYQTLNFSIDTSQFASMENLTIELENPGQVKFPVYLSDYTPVVSGNWASYQIPLSDFTGADLGNIIFLGIWNPRNLAGQLQFGTLYFDNIHLSGGVQN